MKKKITAALTAALMMTVSSVTAFADATGTTITESTTPQTGTTNVTYSVSPSYTVTIPTSVTLGNTATVSVSGVHVANGKSVVVKLTEAKYGDNGSGFKVQSTEGATIDYEVKKGDSATATETVAINGTVLSVASATNGGTGEQKLYFTAPSTVQYSGSYKGTVTFTVSVENTTT